MLRETGCVIAHNLKFDAQKALLIGVLDWDDLERLEFHDTQEIFHLLDENERKALKHLARVVLGESTNEEAVLRKVRRKLGLKKDDGFQHIPREFIVPYAMKDTEFTYRLYEIGMRRLVSKDDKALLDLYRREMDLTKVLLRMESNGLGLDMPYLEATTAEYGARVMEGWQNVVELTGKPDLNPQSPAQLKEAFEARGIYLESTAVSVLRGLNDELAEAILAYRSDKKIHTTYLAGLLREQRDGLVHPWFNLTGARTGRMSSGSASN
jgi:DNA polymerase I-like protein with 3'-5' exonuclease and polymerase domains